MIWCLWMIWNIGKFHVLLTFSPCTEVGIWQETHSHYDVVLRCVKISGQRKKILENESDGVALLWICDPKHFGVRIKRFPEHANSCIVNTIHRKKRSSFPWSSLLAFTNVSRKASKLCIQAHWLHVSLWLHYIAASQRTSPFERKGRRKQLFTCSSFLKSWMIFFRWSFTILLELFLSNSTCQLFTWHEQVMNILCPLSTLLNDPDLDFNLLCGFFRTKGMV